MAGVTGYDLIGLPISLATSRLEAAGAAYAIRTTVRPPRAANSTYAPDPSVKGGEPRVVGCRPGAEGLLLIVAEPAPAAGAPGGS